MSKNGNGVFSANDSEIVDTFYFCALVLWCSIRDFETIKDYSLRFTNAKIKYQKISPEYLHVVKAPPRQEDPET